jgi:MFS family permease
MSSQTVQSNAAPPAGNFRGRLVLIGIGMTLFAIGQSLVFIIVAPLSRSTGLTELQFGLVLTLASLPLVAGAPYWGRKSDRVGRKPIFMVGLFGSAIGTLLVALALQARLSGWLSLTGLVIALLAARAFYSLTGSAIYPSAGGYIADVTDWRSRGQGMAILGASNSLGSIIGPLMVAGLAFAGPLMPMYVAAAVMAVGGIAGLALLKEPERHQVTRRASDLKATDPRLRPYLFMWMAFFLTFSSVQIVTGFFIQDRLGITEPTAVVRTASLCLMSLAVVITVVQAVVFQMYRIPPHVQLRLCGPAFVTSLLLMAFSTGTLQLMAGFAVLGISFACATPGINGSASLAVEPHQQGAAAGYLAASNTVGAILGPLVGTSVYKVAPNAIMLAGAELFLLISFYAFTIRVPQPRKWQ